MTSGARVDVVVLTWNDAEQAHEAVSSVLASRGADVAVTVVDNGSSPPFVHTDPRVRVIRSEANLGVAGGRNVGVRAGERAVVCTLDSDATVRPDSIATLAGALDEPGTGLVGPVYEGVPARWTGGRHPTALRKVARGLRLTSAYAKPSTDGAVDFTIGACQVFRREDFERVGGIPDLGLFAPEDVEFCRLVRVTGLTVRQVPCGVTHDARRSWRNPLSGRGRVHLVALVRYYAGARIRRPG